MMATEHIPAAEFFERCEHYFDAFQAATDGWPLERVEALTQEESDTLVAEQYLIEDEYAILAGEVIAAVA
jgi:hypothetical protein